MRKFTNVFQAVMFALLAFGAYELKAEELNATAVSISVESGTIAPL